MLPVQLFVDAVMCGFGRSLYYVDTTLYVIIIIDC